MREGKIEFLFLRKDKIMCNCESKLILSKKEFIALETAKILVTDKSFSHVPSLAAQAASKAVHALIESCKEF